MTTHDIVHRSMVDEEFAAAVRRDPASALDEYDVSAATVEAFESGDESRIRAALGAEYDAGVPNQ